jgi:HlyD family secretion protein
LGLGRKDHDRHEWERATRQTGETGADCQKLGTDAQAQEHAMIWNKIKERKFLFVLGTLGLGVAGYEWHQLKNDGLVATASAKEKPHRPVILAEGRLAAYPGAEITLSAELSGKIVKLGVKERDRVKSGDVIAELDVKEQRAALNEAWSRVKEAEGDIRYLDREKGRSQQLFAQNVVAQASLDKSVHDASSAERRRASLIASASRLRAEVDRAVVVAPLDGSVTARFTDAGEFVAAGAPLVTIADLSRLRVEAEVGEFDAGRVRVGAPVAIRAEGYDGKVWRGSVEEIPDQVVARQLRPLDPSRPVDTRVLVVKVRLNEPMPLRLAQRVEVEIER